MPAGGARERPESARRGGVRRKQPISPGRWKCMFPRTDPTSGPGRTDDEREVVLALRWNTVRNGRGPRERGAVRTGSCKTDNDNDRHAARVANDAEDCRRSVRGE